MCPGEYLKIAFLLCMNGDLMVCFIVKDLGKLKEYCCWFNSQWSDLLYFYQNPKSHVISVTLSNFAECDWSRKIQELSEG